MRYLVVFAAMLMLSFGVSAGARAESISKAEIAKILTEQGYAVEELNAKALKVTVAQYAIVVGVDGADGDISYLTFLPGLRGESLSFSFLNEFNNSVKFGRAYVDGDGDVAIQMDRNSAGGVSAKNIESDFYIFLLLIDAFLSELESHSIA